MAHERDAVVAPHAGVRRGHCVTAQQPPHAEAPLVGARGLGVVGDEQELGFACLTAGKERQETLLAQVRVVPPYLPRGRIGRVNEEPKGVIRVLLSVLLLDRDGVIQLAVIVHTEPSENRPASLLIQDVREAHARLERAVEWRALRAVGEILARDHGVESRSDGGGRDVVVVDHIRLVVPADAEIQEQAPRGAPVVLDVRPDGSVVRGEIGITRAEQGLAREREAIGREVPELGVAVVVLDGVVVSEVDARAGLDHVLAGPVQAGICYVIAE